MRLQLLDKPLYEEDLVIGALLEPKHKGDAGLDLRSTADLKVSSGETVIVPLGVAVELPEQTVGWLTGRSTTALTMGLFVHEGKIDAGYRGEIHCFCTAQGAPVQITRGDRLCQLIVLDIRQPRWLHVEELGESDRGKAGLGSTGLR